MDKISLDGIRCEALIGVHPEEREARRPIVLDIQYFTDIGRAAHSDDIVDAIDYSKVREAVFRTVRNADFQLIESLAEAVAAAVLEFPGVQLVGVRLIKPSAVPDCAAVSVEIRRKR